MRSLLLPLLLVGIACTAQPIQPVNAIIGDTSYLETYGTAPDATTDEDLRLATHLAYVENRLRETSVDALTEEQQENREVMIDLLHNYWTAGVFPRNEEYPDKRVPCFIDDEGRICALGYLVEQTAGREVAEQINNRHQYEYLADMNDPVVDDWMTNSGLTFVECAMIQPTYGNFYRDTSITCGDSLGTHEHSFYNKNYDSNGSLIMDGCFCEGKICCGKLYVYDADGLLERIEIYQEGKYEGDGVIED